MGVNYSPKIITEGLVLCLDAANPKSYPGSGTTWSDRSGNGNNGTLINGPTFDNGNGGSIVFDGVNDRVQTNFSISEVEATVMLATSPISSTSGYYVAQSAGGGDGGGRFLISATNGKDFSLRIGQQTLVTTGEFNMWYILTVTRNLSGLTTFYNNGVVVGTFTNTTPFVSGRIVDVGGSSFVSDRTIGGRISNVQIYNRALTSDEVLQNYNATKGRYGL